MVKNEKTSFKKLGDSVNIIARNVAEIKSEMATKEDLAATERRLAAKIEAVDEKVDILEEADVRNLQQRVFVLEKDVKKFKT